MATISENLEALQTAKTNIKNAIEGKGQDLTNVPFTQYGEKINEIQTNNIDLSQTTATTEDVLQGKQFYNAEGEFVEGSYIPSAGGEDKFSKFLKQEALEITASDLADVEAIGDYQFYQYPNELKVTIPSNVTSIGNSAFYGCSNLTSITIPSNVTSIGNDAFNRSKLTNIYFEENSTLTLIGYRSFERTNLTSITIPKSVTEIQWNAFDSCANIENVQFEENSAITIIGKQAFYESNLRTITIPKSVTEIQGSAFARCANIENVQFEEGSELSSLGDSAFNIYNMRDENVGIDTLDLSPCTKLTEIRWGVLSIQKINHLILPASIEVIFDTGLPVNMKTLTILRPTPPGMYDIYAIYAPYLTTVYIPKGSLQAYESDEVWSSLSGKFVELDA